MKSSDYPNHDDHYAQLGVEFRRRFWISLVLALPILVLAPMLQKLVGLREALSGRMFFWELATLVDLMLVGHWIAMKRVMGASKALEEFAKLMPFDGRQMTPGGSVKGVLLRATTAPLPHRRSVNLHWERTK